MRGTLLQTCLLAVAMLALPAVLPAFGTQASAIFISLHSFNGGDGASPFAGLVQGSDGYFYGTTAAGGTSDAGTVFRISTKGVLTNLYSTGNNPETGLVQGSDGYLYGTAYAGGTNGSGSVFKISTNGALTSLYSFGLVEDINGLPIDGTNPRAGLVQGSDGYFYGTTAAGGTNDGGTVFKISTNGALTSLYSFGGGNDGGNPRAGLVQGSDGYLYGMTSTGGTNQQGTVFKISTNGVLTSLYSFTGGNDGGNGTFGDYPLGGLVQGSDGYFYGTTPTGGTNGAGTVFKISTNGTLTSLYSFGGDDGSYPRAGLVQGSDGYFYGTTPYGGGAGTVFQISTNGAFTSLYSFTGADDGAIPESGPLVQGSNGSFYGTTFGGGQGNSGTVFRLTIAPEFQAMTLTNGTLTLTWSTEAGGTYQLQYNSD